MTLFKNLKYIAYKIKDGTWDEITKDLTSKDIINPAPDLNIAMEVPTDCVCFDLDFGHVKGNTDSEAQAAVIINKLNRDGIRYFLMKSTSGYHLYFKNRIAGITKIIKSTVANFCPLGLSPIDCKVGTSGDNKMTVRKNGVDREWIKAPSGDNFDTNELDAYPLWLTPLTKARMTTKDGIVLNSWKAESRNFTLFQIGIKNNSLKMPAKDAFDILTSINKYCFAEPLSDSELNSIYDSIQKTSAEFIEDLSKINGKTDKEWCYKWAEHLMFNFEGCKVNGVEYIYDSEEGVYKSLYNFDSDSSSFVENYILETNHSFVMGQRREIIAAFKLMMENPKRNNTNELKRSNCISVKNGILTSSGHLIPNDSTIFTSLKLNVDYVKGYRDEFMTAFEKELFVEVDGDETQIDNFYRFLGSMFFDQEDNCKKALILQGVTNACKSKFLDAIKALLPKSAYAAFPIGDFGLDNSKNFTGLAGKIVNIDDDIREGNWNVDVCSGLKKLIGSGAGGITISPKYLNPVTVELKFKFLSACNELPPMNLYEEATFDRFIVLHCGKTNPKAWEGILKQLHTTESAQKHILAQAVEGWLRFLKSEWAKSPILDALKNEWKFNSSTVAQWLKSEDLSAENIDGKGVNGLYEAYRVEMSKKGKNIFVLDKKFFKQHVVFYYQGKIVLDEVKWIFHKYTEPNLMNELGL